MNRGICVSNAVMLIMGFLAVYSYMGPEGLSLYWCMLVGLATGSIIGPIDDVISGLFVGAMAVFYFFALTMRGVSTGAFEIVNEVRRQFREIKGLLEGKARLTMWPAWISPPSAPCEPWSCRDCW